jgi:hypothetical protein
MAVAPNTCSISDAAASGEVSSLRTALPIIRPVLAPVLPDFTRPVGRSDFFDRRRAR